MKIHHKECTNVQMYIFPIQNPNDFPNLETFILHVHKWKGYTLCKHKMYDVKRNERQLPKLPKH